MKKNYRKYFLVLTLVLAFIASTALAATTNTVNVTINNEPPLEQTGQIGRVGWEQGSSGVIEALGVGVAPTDVPNPRQGQMLARRAAIVDAYRNLAETIQGVRVDSETTMKNLSIADDTVKTQVSALIQGAKIVREIPGSDGTYQVVMSINMYGDNSLAQVALNAIKPAEIQNFPQPAPDYQYEPVKPGVKHHPPISYDYTGVIIDAKNLGLKSTFSPRVYDEDGNIVYGNKYIDPDFAIKYGMVEYLRADEIDAAAANASTRAGTKPLVVNAIRVVDHDNNVVISNDDAQKILAAHAKNGFLAKCAVVFAR